MNVVFATADATLALPEGGVMFVRKGSHWSADDPVVLAHSDLFTADARYGLSASPGHVPADYDAPPVESATRAPGERRVTRRG